MLKQTERLIQLFSTFCPKLWTINQDLTASKEPLSSHHFMKKMTNCKLKKSEIDFILNTTELVLHSLLINSISKIMIVQGTLSLCFPYILRAELEDQRSQFGDIPQECSLFIREIYLCPSGRKPQYQ